MEAKISFGFKKLPKKSAVIGAKPPEEKKVDLIECLDASNIKIVGHVEEDKKALVIPMQGANKNLLDRIKDANDLKERSRIKYKSNGVKDNRNNRGKEEIIDLRPDSDLTIDELAARKLLLEAKSYEKKKAAVKVSTIPLEDQLILEGAKESTMDDYESVPIADFGLAMLRGMGWSEDQAVNKMKVEAPQLRPKGMGLGASVPGNTRNKIPVDKNGKELKLVKDAKARIIAGKEKGNYCIVQGLDDDSGRIIVKTTLTSAVLSLNEFMLFPVSDEEYRQLSKVLNNAKFAKYSKKSERALEKYSKVEKSEEGGVNNDIEYVPNGNDVKIEVSSESEGERERYKQEKNKISCTREIKEEQRSRSQSRHRSPAKDRERSKKESKYAADSKVRERSTSRDKKTSKSSTGGRGRYTTRRSSRSRSRSRSKSTGRSNKRNVSRSRSKTPRKYGNRNKCEGSDRDRGSLEPRDKDKKRDKKTKKSKRHKSKKDKKSKKTKKKSRHRSSPSESSCSSESEYNMKSSRQ